MKRIFYPSRETRLVRRHHIGPVLRGTNILSLTGNPAGPPETTSVPSFVERIFYSSRENRLVRRHHIGPVLRRTNILSLKGKPASLPTPHRSRSSWNESFIHHGKTGLFADTTSVPSFVERIFYPSRETRLVRPKPHRSRTSWNESFIPQGKPGLSADNTTPVPYFVERVFYPSRETRLIRRHHIGPVLRGPNILSLTGNPACPPTTPHRSRPSWTEYFIPNGKPGLSAANTTLVPSFVERIFYPLGETLLVRRQHHIGPFLRETILLSLTEKPFIPHGKPSLSADNTTSVPFFVKRFFYHSRETRLVRRQHHIGPVLRGTNILSLTGNPACLSTTPHRSCPSWNEYSIRHGKPGLSADNSTSVPSLVKRIFYPSRETRHVRRQHHIGPVLRGTNLLSLTGNQACLPTPHWSRPSWNESFIPHGKPGFSADTTSVPSFVERIFYPSRETRLVCRHYIGPILRGTNLLSLTGNPAFLPTPHRSPPTWNGSFIPHGKLGLSVYTTSVPSFEERIFYPLGETRLVCRQHHIGPVLRGTNILSLTGNPACLPTTPHRSCPSWTEYFIPHEKPCLSTDNTSAPAILHPSTSALELPGCSPFSGTRPFQGPALPRDPTLRVIPSETDVSHATTVTA